MKEQASHWYSVKDGKIAPCYEVERADGKGMRSTTLADARKLRLLPSVTTVLSVLRKPAIEQYQLRQLLEAALTLPQRPDETPDEFYGRVQLDAEAHSQKARDFGSRVHAAIELYLTQQRITNTDVDKFTDDFRDWVEEDVESVHGCEFYAASALGYAGRVDLHCTLRGIGEAVVDFKTGKLTNGPKWWPEWGEQLAAYRMAISTDKPLQMFTLLINSETGATHTHLWDDFQGHWDSFQRQHWLWCRRNNYYPNEQSRP